MLKKYSFLVACPAAVFVMQNLTMLCADKLPLLVMPILMIAYPFICVGYGFLGYGLVRYWSCAVVFVSFLVFCFQSVSIASIIWCCYYTLMCLVGILVKKKLSK